MRVKGEGLNDIIILGGGDSTMGARTSKDASENQLEKGDGAATPESFDSKLTRERASTPEPVSSKGTYSVELFPLT